MGGAGPGWEKKRERVRVPGAVSHFRARAHDGPHSGPGGAEEECGEGAGAARLRVVGALLGPRM